MNLSDLRALAARSFQMLEIASRMSGRGVKRDAMSARRTRSRVCALIRGCVAGNTGGTIGFGSRQVCVTAGLPRIPPVDRLAAALASQREPSLTRVALRPLWKRTTRGARSEGNSRVLAINRAINHMRLRNIVAS